MELLRAAGIDAALWFRKPGYRPPWFSTTAPVVGGDQLEFGADDLLVVPELYLLPGVDPAPGVRKVIFNQNHFLTYWSWRDTDNYPGWDPRRRCGRCRGRVATSSAGCIRSWRCG